MLRVSARVYRLPEPGEMVGQYRVVGPLGQGGQSHVFLAECAGRSFVLKFFRSYPDNPWGELEMDILRHVHHPHVVRVLGHGRWPYPDDGYLYLVMEYVQGLPLLRHALEHNPPARKAATLMREAAGALGVVHRQGVLHRDIKPDNLLVRAADGAPVWVDFGVGHLEGRPTPPRFGRLPPGTPEYTSPEAWRFLEEHPEKSVHYRPGVADEVWAFGITLYELLTDRLPFGSRVSNLRMVKDIRARTPLAPHEDNPRVPVALSRVCLHLLEKEPGQRLADMEAVAAALEAALAGAGEDWDVPLMDPYAPQVRTTEEIPGQVVDRDSHERFQRQWVMAMPRRGRVRKARGQPAPQVAAQQEAAPAQHEAPAQQEVAAQQLAPAGQAVPVVPAAREAPVHEVEGAAALVALPPSPPVHRAPSSPRARALAVTLLVGALVLAGTWALLSRPEPRAERPPAPSPLAAPLPPGGWADSPTPHPGLVREVAAPDAPSEAGGGAVASPGSSPAPTSATMPRETATRPKLQQKPAPRPQRPAPGCVPARQELCLVGLCTVLLTGCTPTPQVVRPPPRPADCPPGAVKAMEELGIHISKTGTAYFPPEPAERVTVHESTPMLVPSIGGLDNLGQLAESELTGRLYLGPERVYGRFTQARTRTGKTYPVCLELIGEDTGWGEPPGVERKDVGGPADAAVVFSTQGVRAVERFE